MLIEFMLYGVLFASCSIGPHTLKTCSLCSIDGGIGGVVVMCQRTQYERSWARAATHALVSCNWRGRGGSMIRDHWPRSADVLEVWCRMELEHVSKDHAAWYRDA